MFGLKAPTPPEWFEACAADLDALLADHAHCEHKAAASALSMLAKHPDEPAICDAMVALAHEELEHYQAMAEVVRRRGGRLGHADKDPYVQALLPLARRQGPAEALVDRLLIAGLIEARSAERFFILAEQLEDEELRGFYADFAKTESRHHATFLDLAFGVLPREVVKARFEELAEAEAAIMLARPPEARMH